CQQHYSYPHSF
nr:immunoglobulin light chain junction region [Macaca mulatta]MOX52794.1 immunoglobulin light chain junction region [Macaca mulatta]MOX53820.1 immunoglobulin light chain junction region [Macaca mulatta]MOX54503.1 immunoglobulin light chain junction region [Macaca mulatta]MOX54859.1 immunoglobulin light chain junction region [Macaca mulatta]